MVKSPVTKDRMTKNHATRKNNRVPLVKADESSMNFPLWAAGLLFAAMGLFLGLSQVGWKPAALPTWFWGAVLATGGLGVAGAVLIKQATPERKFTQRALLIGVGWGLPVVFINVMLSLLEGVAFSWISLPIWGTAAACFGMIMAKIGNRS